MCETILTDTDAAARVSQQLRQQDRTLWGKIKDFFKGLVDRLNYRFDESRSDDNTYIFLRDTAGEA